MRVPRKLLTINKLLIWFSIMMACLVPISFIGWLVHYHFIWELGLPELMSWKIPYWLAEMASVISIGIASSSGAWLLARRLHRKAVPILLMTFTVFWQWACGAFDWIWFLIHYLKGFSFPPLNQTWYWSPFSWGLGIQWTTLHHIVYTVLMELVPIILWTVWLLKKRKRRSLTSWVRTSE